MNHPCAQDHRAAHLIMRGRPAAERFWAKVNKTDECWLWTASRVGGGYGRFHPTNGVSVYAHRWAYEQLVGPIPEGLQLDHLCRVRQCVNPSHLEPVTQAENIRRGALYVVECPKGHAYDEANTYRRPGGQRSCRACRCERWHAQAALRARLKPVPPDRTHCRHGHPWTEANVYNGNQCRACRTEAARRYRARAA
jgi:hypothetical protein